MIVRLMAAQPTETVTMLFTDIEGSTRLLLQLGRERYAEALELHRRLLRECFGRHGGYEVDCEGDAFFIAFSRAEEAVAAAAEGQEALTEAEWPDSEPFKVRMGIHTGTPLAVPPKYVGIDVHRAARIMAAAYGGQVLVSAATVALLDGSFALRDLGEHRLKDLLQPERLHQLGDGAFPALRTLHRTNLPVPPTAFVGRERELAELSALLAEDDVRLVTLTGPGGTGKTRLALQALAECADRYPDGVMWVPLAALVDSELMLASVVQALDLQEEPGRSSLQTLTVELAGKQLLLLLDNAEHLLPGLAVELGSLVGACPTVRFVVTSRERLRIQAEHLYPVASLGEADGVELFIVRARQLDPGFVASPDLPAVCGRLDNLPLALELAAARTGLFSVEQLLERLDRRLGLLTGGRDADPRQQTLRATIEWSYDLLDEPTKRLFRQLSVFVGGCTFEGAEQVCGADPDILQALLDKSFLRRAGERYWMLETIREYAGERLEDFGGAEEVRESHGAWYLALAEQAGVELRTARVGVWLDRLEDEHRNLRAVLERAVDRGDGDLALRVTGGIWRFWQIRGHWAEGRHRLDEALALCDGTEPELRIDVLCGACVLALEQADTETAAAHSVELLRLGRTHRLDRGERIALELLARVAARSGDFRRARELFERALELARAAGDAWEVGVVLNNLGDIALNLGELELAASLLEEGIATEEARDDADPRVRIYMLMNLGAATAFRGDLTRSRGIFRTVLQASAQIGLRTGLLSGLLGLAASSTEGHPSAAARLLGSSDAASEELGSPPDGFEVDIYKTAVAALRISLGDEAWDAAYSEGRALPLDDAVAEALAL